MRAKEHTSTEHSDVWVAHGERQRALVDVEHQRTVDIAARQKLQPDAQVLERDMPAAVRQLGSGEVCIWRTVLITSMLNVQYLLYSTTQYCTVLLKTVLYCVYITVLNCTAHLQHHAKRHSPVNCCALQCLTPKRRSERNSSRRHGLRRGSVVPGSGVLYCTVQYPAQCRQTPRTPHCR